MSEWTKDRIAALLAIGIEKENYARALIAGQVSFGIPVDTPLPPPIERHISPEQAEQDKKAFARIMSKTEGPTSALASSLGVGHPAKSYRKVKKGL